MDLCNLPYKNSKTFWGKDIKFVNLLKDKFHREFNQLFFSIEAIDTEKDIKEYHHKSIATGYITVTNQMEKFVKENFFTGCNGLKFIQWDNGVWNVVFNEATIIGSVSFRITDKQMKQIFNNTQISESLEKATACSR